MKIINHGMNNKHNFKGICNKCGCEFIVTKKELFDYNSGDYKNDYKGFGKYFCPEPFCKNLIICIEI